MLQQSCQAAQQAVADIVFRQLADGKSQLDAGPRAPPELSMLASDIVGAFDDVRSSLLLCRKVALLGRVLRLPGAGEVDSTLASMCPALLYA